MKFKDILPIIIPIIFVLVILGVMCLFFIQIFESGKSMEKYQAIKEKLVQYCVSLNTCETFNCLARISTNYNEGSYWLLREQNCILNKEVSK